MQKTKFKNEAIDLEHRKLLSEYNALSVALASVTLGIAGLVYTLKHDIKLSLGSLIVTFFVLNVLRWDKSKELDKKVKEIRSL